MYPIGTTLYNPEDRAVTRTSKIHVGFIDHDLLASIISGKKRLIVCIQVERWKNALKGDSLDFNGEGVIRKIADIRNYQSLKATLSYEDPDKILPGRSGKDVLLYCKDSHPSYKGTPVIVFELAPS